MELASVHIDDILMLPCVLNQRFDMDSVSLGEQNDLQNVQKHDLKYAVRRGEICNALIIMSTSKEEWVWFGKKSLNLAAFKPHLCQTTSELETSRF